MVDGILCHWHGVGFSTVGGRIDGSINQSMDAMR
jgi:hypothetical protein